MLGMGRLVGMLGMSGKGMVWSGMWGWWWVAPGLGRGPAQGPTPAHRHSSLPPETWSRPLYLSNHIINSFPPFAIFSPLRVSGKCLEVGLVLGSQLLRLIQNKKKSYVMPIESN